MMRVRDRRRSYANKHDRPLREADLIPLTTALEMLTDWHGRKYTLADFQLEAIQGHNMCTPLFRYNDKAVIFNPHILATDDLLTRFDGEIPYRFYESYYQEWLNVEQDILTVNNHFFCLDFGGILGAKDCVLNNFTEYLANPQIKIPLTQIRPALYINNATVTCGDYVVMPITDYHPLQTSIKPKDISPSFSVGLYDWYIPLKQVEHLHPNYTFIWKVNNKYYILDYSNDKNHPMAKKVKLSDYDPRFCTVMEDTRVAPLTIKLLNRNNDKSISNDIGHNKKAKDRKQQALNLATEIWGYDNDHEQLIKTGDMVKILKSILPALSKVSEQTVKNYFSEARPNYAKQGGTPNNQTTTQQRHKKEYIQRIINLYTKQ